MTFSTMKHNIMTLNIMRLVLFQCNFHHVTSFNCSGECNYAVSDCSKCCYADIIHSNALHNANQHSYMQQNH